MGILALTVLTGDTWLGLAEMTSRQGHLFESPRWGRVELTEIDFENSPPYTPGGVSPISGPPYDTQGVIAMDPMTSSPAPNGIDGTLAIQTFRRPQGFPIPRMTTIWHVPTKGTEPAR